MVDVIIPVYRPDEKLEKLIERLNQQTVEPAHIFFMQTMTEDEAEDTRVRKILENQNMERLFRLVNWNLIMAAREIRGLR